MKFTIGLTFVFVFIFDCLGLSQPNHQEIREDLAEILNDIERNYIYLNKEEEKN